MYGFFLLPIVAYANISTKIESKVLVDSGNSSVYIGFSGQEAKSLWEYLEKIQKSGNGFVLRNAGMSKKYLTSPVVACKKSNYTLYDNIPDKDPRLYSCHISLNSNGLPVVN